MGDPREPTDPRSSQALRRRRSRARRAIPRAVGPARSCARRSRAGSGAASASPLDPDTRGHPDARLEGGDLLVRAGRARRAGGRDTRRPDRARLPGLRARRAVRRRRVVQLPLREENGFLPDLDAVDDETWRARRSSGSTTRTTRPAPSRRSRSTSGRGARARARLRARLRRGLHGALVRRAAASRRSSSRTGTNVVVFNTLSKRSSMTGYRSGFVAGDPELDRRAAAVPAERRARRRRSSSSAPRSSPGTTRSTSSDARALYAAQARRCSSTSSSASGLRVAGSDGDDVPLGRGARGRDVRGLRRRASSSTASSSRPARSSARPARATSASRSSRPRTSAPRRARSWRSAVSELASDRGSGSGELDAAGRGGHRAARPRASCASPSSGDGEWVVNEWAKKAILLYFRLRKVEPMERRAVRVPRQDPAQARLRGARRARRAARRSRATARSSPRASS